MSKKEARRIIASLKPGCTVKEFLYYCEDMGEWFDLIIDQDLTPVYEALTREETTTCIH